MLIKPLLLMFLLTFLVGCQENVRQTTASAKRSEVKAPSSVQSKTPLLPHKKTPQEKRLAYEQHTKYLVFKGEEALAHDRLTTPPYANANAYFKEALARDPQNYKATLGLLNVLQTYAQWAWQAAQQGQYQKADKYLAAARQVKAHFSETEVTRQRIDTLKKRRQHKAENNAHQASPSSSLSARVAKENEYLLPKNLFTLSDDEILAKIQPIIDKVAAEKSEVVIKWPDDKKARLLYQIINSRVSGFRVRAMIYHQNDYSIELHKAAQ